MILNGRFWFTASSVLCQGSTSGPDMQGLLRSALCSPALPGLWEVVVMYCSSSQLLRKHAVPFGVAKLESAYGNYSLMPDLTNSELIKVYFQ